MSHLDILIKNTLQALNLSRIQKEAMLTLSEDVDRRAFTDNELDTQLITQIKSKINSSDIDEIIDDLIFKTNAKILTS